MNFPVIMLGELQDTEIDLDVMFNIAKFCGGSSGAAMQKHTDIIIFIHAVFIVYANNVLIHK